MSGSHEQIERLLGERPEVGGVGPDFGERVASGIGRTPPGGVPVAAGVMPTGVKAGLLFGAVGVVSAAVWMGTRAPSVDSNAIDAPSTGIANDDSGSADLAGDRPWEEGIAIGLDAFKSLKNGVDDTGPMGLLDEGRKLLANGKTLGTVFVSAFPREWTALLLGDSFFSGGSGSPTGSGAGSEAGANGAASDS